MLKLITFTIFVLGIKIVNIFSKMKKTNLKFTLNKFNNCIKTFGSEQLMRDKRQMI